MRMLINILALAFLMVSVPGGVFAGDLFVYPEKGQGKEQVERDKHECYLWAKGETGFDPMAQPTATTPPPQAGAPEGGVVKGAARGALLGVAVGAIAGDAGTGAAAGAAAGGLMGGFRRRDQVKRQEYEQQQWEQEQAANYQRNRDLYNRAYGACLEGKGYTVK